MFSIVRLFLVNANIYEHVKFLNFKTFADLKILTFTLARKSRSFGLRLLQLAKKLTYF